MGMAYPPAGLSVGQILEGKYKIVREIGRGAMGVVYEGVHITLDRRVAVKTLRQEMSNDPDLATRFEREARAASAIGHPHIVDVFDLGRTPDGLLFMVMELLDGKPLGVMLQETPLMPIPLAVHLITQVLSGLSAAHKHGIVHRDLKPDNIFVINTEDRPNFVKIVDFGIAKKLSTRQPGQVTPAAMSGTMVGTVMGTPLYMSPEQAIGQVEQIDHRTDIHAVGVVFYEMLCGRTPFQGLGYAAILGSILEGNYPPPRLLRPDLPAHMEAAIMRALDRDIGKRFPSAAAMREAIVRAGAAPIAGGPGTSPDEMPLTLATLDGQEAGAPGFSLLENIPPPQTTRPVPAGRPGPVRGPGGDRFAPPPTEEAPLELGGTRWGSSPPPRPSARGGDEGPPLERRRKPEEPRRPAPVEPPAPRHAPSASSHDGSDDDGAPPPNATRSYGEAPVITDRPRSRPQTPGTLAPEPVFSARTRRLLGKLGIGLGVLIAARVGYHFWQAGSLDKSTTNAPAASKGVMRKVALVLDPPDTSVQIDHIPTSKRELQLDSATPHLLNATAPGRLTRRFSFQAKSGLKLEVRMNHLLLAPSPLDPPPMSAELSVRYPETPRPSEEIDRAFAKLDKVAQCLAAAGDTGEGGKNEKGAAHVRLHGEDLARCQVLVREAHALAPAMPSLETAADAYLAAVQGGQKLEVVMRASAVLRAELLAARSVWQWEELALQEKIDGRKAAWHMRRFALDANAWLRALKSDPPSQQAVDEQASSLQEIFNLFLEYAESARPEMARTTGANDFMKAAQDTMALVRPTDGKLRSEFAALSACRRVVAAFNALVTE